MAAPRFEVVVRQLLDRHLADGLGFIDERGETYRQYYYDVEAAGSDNPTKVPK